MVKQIDCFFSYTRQSERRGWVARMLVLHLARILQHRGQSHFIDSESLCGSCIETCIGQAGSARVLICMLDDAFPSRWCYQEILAAIGRRVPIVTVFDQECFRFEDVGKDVWRRRNLPDEVVQAVFARGAVPFNTNPHYVGVAEKVFEETLMNLLQTQQKRPLPARVMPGPEEEEDTQLCQGVLPCCDRGDCFVRRPGNARDEFTFAPCRVGGGVAAPAPASHIPRWAADAASTRRRSHNEANKCLHGGEHALVREDALHANDIDIFLAALR